MNIYRTSIEVCATIQVRLAKSFSLRVTTRTLKTTPSTTSREVKRQSDARFSYKYIMLN